MPNNISIDVISSFHKLSVRTFVVFVGVAVFALAIACTPEGQGQVVRDSSSSESSIRATVPADALSRLSVTLLGELVESGFEAVFVEMYDARDRPMFDEGSMHLEFKDRLGNVLYSRLFTVGRDARWGPTLDGSQGALLKIPLDDFDPGFPGPLYVAVSFNGEKGSAQTTHIEDFLIFTSVPVLEGEGLKATVNSIWADISTDIDGEFAEVDSGFFGDPYSFELEAFGCSFGLSEFGISEEEMFRVSFSVVTTGGGISEVYLPTAFLAGC